MIVLFPSIDTWIGSVVWGRVLTMSASCRDWDKSIPMWAPTTPSWGKIDQLAGVLGLLTSATRWRSEGAFAKFDQIEEQKEALSRHESKRSAIALDCSTILEFSRPWYETDFALRGCGIFLKSCLALPGYRHSGPLDAFSPHLCSNPCCLELE